MLWVRFDEAEGPLALYNDHAKKFGPGKAPGDAAGRRFIVEVKASDDRGNAQDWQRAGSLTVTRFRHR